MRKSIKFQPVILFFFTQDITQEQAVTAQDHWSNGDVHYRLNANVKLGDILEGFDGLAGAPPAAYIADATARGKRYIPCTMAEVTAGTAPKFTSLDTEATAMRASLPVGDSPQTLQDAAATGHAASLVAPTDTVVQSSTLQAPSEGAPNVLGNPATSTT